MPFTLGHPVYGGEETRFKKGHSLRVGMKHTEESIKKMSESRKGKALGSENAMANPEYRKRVSEAKKGIPLLNFRGENHPNWKNGKENLRIRGRLEYKQWRNSVFERDDWTCQECNKRGGQELNAHHVKSFAKHPELRFVVNNGQTLCIDCHKETDTYLKGGNS